MKCGLELGLKSVCALWYVGRQVVKSWLLKDMQLPLHEHCFLLLRRKQLRGISVHASGRLLVSLSGLYPLLSGSLSNNKFDS